MVLPRVQVQPCVPEARRKGFEAVDKLNRKVNDAVHGTMIRDEQGREVRTEQGKTLRADDGLKSAVWKLTTVEEKVANRESGLSTTADCFGGSPYIADGKLHFPVKRLGFDKGVLKSKEGTEGYEVSLEGVLPPENALHGTYGPFLYNAPYVQNGKLYFPTVNVSFDKGWATAITVGETIEVELP